jgi:hypothetical protein
MNGWIDEWLDDEWVDGAVCPSVCSSVWKIEKPGCCSYCCFLYKHTHFCEELSSLTLRSVKVSYYLPHECLVIIFIPWKCKTFSKY